MSRKQVQFHDELQTVTSDIQTVSPRMRVIRSIRQWIDDGELSHGDRLPAEMVLARKLDVSRDTVRAALMHLEKQGLLSNSRNRTRQVVSQSQKQPSGLSLMSKSIAVLASFGKPDERYASCNMGAVQQEAVEQISKSGWHALRLEPQHVAEEGFAQQLLGDPPAGLLISEGVILNSKARVLIEQAIASGIPVVINDDGPDMDGCDHVIFDHFTGSRIVTQYLIEHGARNIVPMFCCDMSRTWAQKRLAGYEAVMQEAGLEPMSVNWIDAQFDQVHRHSAEKHFELQTRLFTGYMAPLLRAQRVPDAVITINDGHVFPLAAACRLLGLKPNIDIKIAGYDNSWFSAPEKDMEPTRPFVTVEKNNPQAGREMVRLLVDRLENRLSDEPQVCKIEPSLIIPSNVEIP